MSPVSFLPAIVSVLVAILTSTVIVCFFGAPPLQGRYATIDGLRGYLAFFVFLHHASIWYFFLRTNIWRVPPSSLYTHFGQSSVALFFMITGFLFFSKLIDGRRKGVDWAKLFISRFMRLVPLYLFAMMMLFCIIATLSKGVAEESFFSLLKSAVRWLGFTILGSPPINGMEFTPIIVAGVTWSLPYEWFFYLSLPFMALLLRVKTPLPYLSLGCVALCFLLVWHPEKIHLLPFAGGIVAAFVVRSQVFLKLAPHWIFSVMILLFAVLAVAVFPSGNGKIPITLFSLIFIFIAGGNTLFGVLTNPISRTLGELAYSIYLLHGIMLFVLFTCIIGIDRAAQFSTIQHWTVIGCMSSILVLISFVTFRLIERPAMRSTNTVALWLKSAIALRRV